MALYKGQPDELIEQDKNAQVMTPEAFDRLSATVARDKRLEQLPFAVLRDTGKHELISGHHRKRAANKGKLTEIYWLSDTRTDMARGDVVAKQLAHNSIHGEPDPAMLKELYDEMVTADQMMESHVSPDDFDGVGQLEAAEAVDLGLSIQWKAITLVFTPAVLESLERIENFFSRHVPANTDMVGVLPHDLLARVRQVALNIAKVEDVRSLGAVFARMCEIVEAHIEATNPDASKALPAPADSAQGLNSDSRGIET